MYLRRWMFMQTLALGAFFGILLTQGNSYRVHLIWCYITVFSTAAFSYILADLDSPYHGSFCVNLKNFSTFLETMSRIYDNKPVQMEQRMSAVNSACLI